MAQKKLKGKVELFDLIQAVIKFEKKHVTGVDPLSELRLEGRDAMFIRAFLKLTVASLAHDPKLIIKCYANTWKTEMSAQVNKVN